MLIVWICKVVFVITAYTQEVPTRSMDYDSPQERTVTVEELVTVCIACTNEEFEAGTCPTDC